MLLALIQAAALAVPLLHADPPIDGTLSSQAWKSAQSVTLDWDLQGHKHAPQQTTAYVATDGKYLYVAFDAKQDGTITATQHTDDAGQGTDDDVEIDLWPGGTNGFLYQFIANPIGTHYQYSSENSGYRPEWWSAGTVHDGGYVVTMKIPLAAIHGVNSKRWLVQFGRKVESTGDIDVWSYDSNETDTTTSTYAGILTGLQVTAIRPQPRVELYGLGLAGGKSIGGSTSRAGVDFSVPFTATSSFYATLHPDYSNVELDQQSISPTAFRRYLSEVRP
ncbi:MAG TPA: sugar-binding protein, partial [Candidatus Tumulicola sp.]|nr:sugar-binding protein [Candidatus Tumulicola sp.]